jgi:hypothetical protein
MSAYNNNGEALPLFTIPTAELPTAIHDGQAVTALDAVAGLRRALTLGEGDVIEGCYVANRSTDEVRGLSAGMVIGSVIREADGFWKDREIIINGADRHEPMGEQAITWFGAIAADYDKSSYVNFMRGQFSPIVVQEGRAVGAVA